MKPHENDKWLDDALSETIGSKKPRTDFEQWKQKHPQAVEMLTSRAKLKTSTIKSPHTIRIKIMKSPITKLAAAIALICMGVTTAAVVGVKIYKYYYFDEHPEAGYRVLREDGRKMWSFSKKTADSPEQAVQTAEEMDLLIQQGIKELVSVREIEVNGQLDSRLLGYEYTLSDGRKVRQYEDDPDTGAGTLVGERKDEARQRWMETLEGMMSYSLSDGQFFHVTADGQEVSAYEQVVQGRTFSFEKVPFVLRDGTKVAWSMSRLVEEGQSSTKTSGDHTTDTEQERKDILEITSLRQQDKRQLIAVDELMTNGELDRKVFVYKYQLSDGRTMDMREGAGGGNYILNKTQRQEWVQRKNSGSGEDLGTYEQKVKDRLFLFKRQRFTLSDGTELIWSYGTLKENQ